MFSLKNKVTFCISDLYFVKLCVVLQVSVLCVFISLCITKNASYTCTKINNRQ